MSNVRFRSRQQIKQSPLIGLTLSTYDPVFVDIAAHFSIDVVWIEMEHSCMTMREAENLCRIISGNQMLSLIRLPNGERDTVLKAAESGADMLMMPMVNEPAELKRFVSHAKYAPLGERGYYRPSRAMKYGLGESIAELRRQANENLMLWGQIETLSALSNLEELGQVDGIDGLFMGPGDLSSAYGVPGDISDPRVIDAVATGVSTSHAHQKLSGTVSTPVDVPRWISHSVDMLVVGSNVGFYISAAEALRIQLNSVSALRRDSAGHDRWSFGQVTTGDVRNGVTPISSDNGVVLPSFHSGK